MGAHEQNGENAGTTFGGLCIGALQILEMLHKKCKTLMPKQCTSSSGAVDVAQRHGCDIRSFLRLRDSFACI